MTLAQVEFPCAGFVCRVWRAMNAISFGGEVDPDDTHGIVRSGGKIELFLNVDTTQVKRRVIVINRVLGDLLGKVC